MALTQSAWTVSTVGKSVLKATCTVTATTAENDAYTLKTPKELDVRRPWTLFLVTSATPDGQALPVDIWAGYADNFALSGDGANVVATGTGAKYKQIIENAVTAVTPLAFAFHFDPNQEVADVVTVAAIDTGLKVKIPVAPYYAFNLNGGSTLNAHTATWTIVQPS